MESLCPPGRADTSGLQLHLSWEDRGPREAKSLDFSVKAPNLKILANIKQTNKTACGSNEICLLAQSAPGHQFATSDLEDLF